MTIRRTLTAAVFIMITGGLCYAAMEISQGVVFQVNGTIDIICSTDDFESQPEVIFIWRHNESLKERGETNFQGESQELRLYYKLHIDTATENDTGTYACSIEGKPEVVSMSATMVKVNDTPLIAKMDDTLEMHILKDANQDIKCFTADTVIDSVEGCVKHIKVTDTTVSKIHEYVIASSKAIGEYGTIENAIQRRTTFNFSKAIIGLETTDKDGKITLTFKGNSTIIQNLEVGCHESIQKLSLRASKGPSYGVQTFECDRNGTQPVTVEVFWKGRSLRSFLLTAGKDSSGAAHVTFAHLHLWWILLALILF